jgi:hypothetical protein
MTDQGAIPPHTRTRRSMTMTMTINPPAAA